MSLGVICKHLSPVLRSGKLLQRVEPVCATAGKRYLFSHDRLGLEGFKRNKAYHFEKMGHLKEKFCVEVEQFLEQKDSVVFTADLKTMVHLAETEQDLSLMGKMIKLYQKQQTDLSFAQFNFGPPVLRILYLLNRPDSALDLFMDEDLSTSGFFDQMSSQVILLDLLYENEKYDDIHRVMDVISKKQVGGIKYPMDCVTIALATCLKQNSLASYEKALEYLQGCQATGLNMSHRGVIYAALLAIKQEKYNEAMEMISLAPVPYGRRRQPQAMLNLKLIANIKVKRLEEALLLLRSVLENDVPDHVKTGSEIFIENLVEVEKAVVASENKELIHQYESLKKGLEQGNHLVDADFEAYTLRTIISARKYQDGHKQRRQTMKNQQPLAQR